MTKLHGRMRAHDVATSSACHHATNVHRSDKLSTGVWKVPGKNTKCRSAGSLSVISVMCSDHPAQLEAQAGALAVASCIINPILGICESKSMRLTQTRAHR